MHPFVISDLTRNVSRKDTYHIPSLSILACSDKMALPTLLAILFGLGLVAYPMELCGCNKDGACRTYSSLSLAVAAGINCYCPGKCADDPPSIPSAREFLDCPNDSEEPVCILLYDPVCACRSVVDQQINRTRIECSTASNECFACKPTAPAYFFRGECPKGSSTVEENIVYGCPAKTEIDKQKIQCTEESNPVCGCWTATQCRTFPNPCYACSSKEQDILSWTFGAC